ncbi:MAG: DUF2804 domain-containing protein [Clostridiales bacterium]|jgi:hypothetical protein|nr:DUF2804 domain-containing protein [Clostridiales bacterium]
MANQHEVTTPQKLLKNGDIAEPGYAKTLIWQYDRADITARPIRVKEWDYYIIADQKKGVAMTISDSGFIGVIDFTLFDYITPRCASRSAARPFPLGRMNMTNTSVKGDLKARQGGICAEFLNDGNTRLLRGTFPGFGKKKRLVTVEIELTDIPAESMVIATPFGKPGHFYYNQKINCMRAGGTVTIGDEVLSFDPAESFATLEWGRGVWTYDNTWYWSSLNTALPDGSVFGWNLGYGFGDTSAATENMLFYNGIAHKLDVVTFNIPQKDGKDDYMSPWTFTSNDGRLEMDFLPVLDRNVEINIGVIAQLPHQVFGKFTGKAVLDDGTVIEIKDRLGFAEKVRNKW